MVNKSLLFNQSSSSEFRFHFKQVLNSKNKKKSFFVLNILAAFYYQTFYCFYQMCFAIPNIRLYGFKILLGNRSTCTSRR